MQVRPAKQRPAGREAIHETTVGGLALAVALIAYRADAGPVLDAVKARGQLVCGVNTGTAGFMQPDRQGKWTGFAVDICRAVAARSSATPTR